MQKRHADRARYFEESAATSEEFYMPYIGQYREKKSAGSVMEIGCGEGGNLMPFAQQGWQVTGIDICEDRIRQAKHYFRQHGAAGDFICGDFLTCPPPREETERYDLILLHDVIEHIHDKETFIRQSLRFLKSEGILFVAFPAWQMPFGGHQQIARHPVWSKIPFYHLLPTAVYRFILRHLAHEDSRTVSELTDIKQCRTSIERFESIVRSQHLHVLNRQLWFINPHYRQKFGLKPIRLHPLFAKLPYVRNYCSTSCFYLLQQTKGKNE
ncbi:MAG: class I SAM-dependent methyltransferase [Prevotella sp.]|nr:class I SAM-dependent methyltransferase [Prevotella sp.]